MLPEQKLICGHIIFIHTSYIEIVDKIAFINPKIGQLSEVLFLGGSSISLLLKIGS